MKFTGQRKTAWSPALQPWLVVDIRFERHTRMAPVSMWLRVARDHQFMGTIDLGVCAKRTIWLWCPQNGQVGANCYYPGNQQSDRRRNYPSPYRFNIGISHLICIGFFSFYVLQVHGVFLQSVNIDFLKDGWKYLLFFFGPAWKQIVFCGSLQRYGRRRPIKKAMTPYWT